MKRDFSFGKGEWTILQYFFLFFYPYIQVRPTDFLEWKNGKT